MCYSNNLVLVVAMVEGVGFVQRAQRFFFFGFLFCLFLRNSIYRCILERSLENC